MIAVIFEVIPAEGRKDDYLAQIRPVLDPRRFDFNMANAYLAVQQQKAAGKELSSASATETHPRK